ncbi:hypothetical protein PIB30_039102 [Stylosanthes scabra]|uniref:Uncharacterized protein n=1 Tax=Stylosanthes scabra TaxID=79078 RepID=A0ABU6ZCX4_9FABA|nr:hypothetical protein [Stylosanthes scabra]
MRGHVAKAKVQPYRGNDELRAAGKLGIRERDKATKDKRTYSESECWLMMQFQLRSAAFGSQPRKPSGIDAFLQIGKHVRALEGSMAKRVSTATAGVVYLLPVTGLPRLRVASTVSTFFSSLSSHHHHPSYCVLPRLHPPSFVVVCEQESTCLVAYSIRSRAKALAEKTQRDLQTQRAS